MSETRPGLVEPYDLGAIQDHAETCEYVRASYFVGESGWLGALPDGRYFVANVPFTNELHIFDVVEVTRTNQIIAVSRVVHSFLPTRWTVRYAEGSRGRRKEALEVCRSVLKKLRESGVLCEAITRGWIAANAPADVDVGQLLRDAGIDEDNAWVHTPGDEK